MSSNDKENEAIDRQRPIADAALAVEDTAIKAAVMLDQLKSGWLWALITHKPTQTPKA